MLCDLDAPQADAAYLENLVTAGMRTAHTLLKASAVPPPSRILQNVFASSNIFTKLLPGGRFLITAALEAPRQGHSSILQLWDLALPDDKVLVATERFDKPIQDCKFRATPDSSAVRLVVSSGNRCVEIPKGITALSYDVSCTVRSCLTLPLWRSGGPPSSLNHRR